MSSKPLCSSRDTRYIYIGFAVLRDTMLFEPLDDEHLYDYGNLSGWKGKKGPAQQKLLLSDFSLPVCPSLLRKPSLRFGVTRSNARNRPGENPRARGFFTSDDIAPILPVRAESYVWPVCADTYRHPCEIIVVTHRRGVSSRYGLSHCCTSNG